MPTQWRHLPAILALPFLVVIVVPYVLLSTTAGMDSRWGDDLPVAWVVRAVGVIVVVAGFALSAWCVRLFANVGEGTLAPWDPTHKLVAVGPYRHVRNPMISGVALMLLGQSLFWGSWAVALWTALFVGINHAYFLLSEEPGLEKRFGASYRVYKANVPRWLPRWQPWSGQ